MNETDLLKEELEHYRAEKEAVRKVVGQIGGTGTKKHHRTINMCFIAFVLLFFIFDLVRNIAGIDMPFFPEMMSIELAVLLVSAKIIWMIHNQTKVEHFQFWILNSIEFQMNSMARRIRKIELMINEQKNKAEERSGAEGRN